MNNQAILFIAFLLFQNISFGQTLTIALGNNEVYLEKKSDNFRLGPSAKRTLIEGLNIAIEWSELNENHKKSFTKEVRRFQIMNKQLYQNLGYESHLSTEMKLMFTGYSSGTSKCWLSIPTQNRVYWNINDKQSLKDFLKLMKGQSINEEIDNIFKN